MKRMYQLSSASHRHNNMKSTGLLGFTWVNKKTDVHYRVVTEMHSHVNDLDIIVPTQHGENKTCYNVYNC